MHNYYLVTATTLKMLESSARVRMLVLSFGIMTLALMQQQQKSQAKEIKSANYLINVLVFPFFFPFFCCCIC